MTLLERGGREAWVGTGGNTEIARARIYHVGDVAIGALVLAAEIAGADFARALQLMLEYDPAPPFAAGSPEKAGPEVVNQALTALAAQLQQLAARTARRATA